MLYIYLLISSPILVILLCVCKIIIFNYYDKYCKLKISIAEQVDISNENIISVSSIRI